MHLAAQKERSHFYYLVSARPDADISDGRPSKILKAIDICSGGRWQFSKTAHFTQIFLPARHRLINRFDSANRLDVSRHAIDRLSIKPIADCNRYFRKRIENVQLGYSKSG